MTRPTSENSAAIIGMACVFPGAADLATFWENIEAGVDAIRDAPAERWEPVFYDPDSTAVDRFYNKRGGFLDEPLTFDAPAWGVMPVAAQGAEPDQLLSLAVAARALADAGYDRRPFARERTAVMLGRGNYIGAGMTRLEQHVRTAEQLVTSLRTLVPGLTEAQLGAVKADFQSQLGGYGPDTAIGLVPNLTASRIANRLDLKGPAFTIDGACASALLAVDRACRDLAAGEIDLALAGGVHLSHDVAFWSVFCQLGAMSRSQQIRPFDRRADGLLPGEGIGVVVLKRAADAERDGDRVYAVVRGTGVASDGRGASLMVPQVDGQRLALARAWQRAALDPQTIGLIEAHGTATPVGDASELETLAGFFGPPSGDAPRAGLGSVKSMIGHTMPAAGAAGLIKAALAVHHGVLPPTLHCEQPLAALEQTRFRPITAAEPWEDGGRPRRAGVNAFGFGGINAHVVLESAPGATAPRGRRRRRDVEETLLVRAAATPGALAAALDAAADAVGEGPCRLALVNPTPERRARAREVVRAGKPRRGRDGLWFSPRGLVAEGGRVAFLFPGVEAAFAPRAVELIAHFGKPSLPDVPEGDLERQGAAVVALGRTLDEVLREVGVRPDALAGHSIGEWNGLIAAGMIPRDDLAAFVDGLAPGGLEVPGVVFAALGAGVERAAAVVDTFPAVTVTHDNCPHQAILCGPEPDIDAVLAQLRELRVAGHKLPFRSGFHSSAFAAYVAPHRANFAKLRLRPDPTPLWSATTCSPYPADPEAIREVALDHLVQPVRFRELVDNLYADGVRAFLQLGSGSLVGFVSDTLRGRPHLAMSACAQQRHTLAQVRRLAAALFVEGVDVDWARLLPPAERRPSGPVPLALGVPLVKLRQALPLEALGRPAREDRGDGVLAGFEDVLGEVREAQAAVRRAWKKGSRAPAKPLPAPKTVVRTRRLSVEDAPFLRDHGLLPQPPEWPCLADRDPVVPMTMSVRILMEAAQATSPGRVVTALEGVRAHKWLAVEPAVEVTVRATPKAPGEVEAAIEGYVEATARTAAAYPPAPAPNPRPLKDARAADIEAAQLYGDRWMFHGPAYQAVLSVDEMGADGIRGTLEALPAEGALMDAAGQLFGYWVMATVPRDRLAMPIKIDRFEVFGPEPAPGERLVCTVWVDHVGVRDVRADMELVGADGRVWARVEGWTDWRFETDDRLWAVMHRPEKHVFSDIGPGGLAVVDEPKRSAANRDYLARRYLDERERAAWRALVPRRQAPWLYGRIAVKDAVRQLLWRRGAGDLYPVEIAVYNDEGGAPYVRGPFDGDLRVSIAHKATIAVAAATEGRPIGVDVERVAPREPATVGAILTPAERALLPEEDRDIWVTCFFCAKEVVGKARGEGLAGSPKRFQVTKIADEGDDRRRLRIDDRWVATELCGEHVLAWMEETDG